MVGYSKRDLLESWRLLSPPSSIQSHLPGRPRVPNQDSPRVATPTSPLRTFSPAPARSPVSDGRSPHPSVTPRRLTFDDSPLPPVVDSPSPLVVAPSPRVVIEPTLPQILPPREPIAHRTRSQAPAQSFALLAGARPLGFAGLCEAFSLSPNEVDRFANLCSSLEQIDGFGPSALSVLHPTTGEFLEHRQLCQDPRYKAVWDTSYANELGRLFQGIGSGNTPTKQ
jgi:hypothetical protein